MKTQVWVSVATCPQTLIGCGIGHTLMPSAQSSFPRASWPSRAHPVLPGQEPSMAICVSPPCFPPSLFSSPFTHPLSSTHERGSYLLQSPHHISLLTTASPETRPARVGNLGPPHLVPGFWGNSSGHAGVTDDVTISLSTANHEPIWNHQC